MKPLDSMENNSFFIQDNCNTPDMLGDCMKGSVENIKKEIHSGSYDLKSQSKETKWSLLEAASESSLEIFKFLMTNLSDIECNDCGYYGLVYITLKKGYGNFATDLKKWFDNVDDDLSQFLAEHCIQDKTDNNRIAIIAACLDGHIEKVDNYISDTKNIITDCSDSNGLNLLHVASLMGNRKIFDTLASKIDQLNIMTNKGNSPLHLACIKGDMTIIKSLAKYEECPLNTDCNTLLHITCRYGHLNVIKYFIEDKKWSILQKEFAPLHVATTFGHINIIHYLCTTTHSDVNQVSFTGEAPIHLASKHGHLDVVKYFTEDMLCDKSIKDSKGNTAIHLACRYGFNNIASYLANCSEISSKNHQGMTSLHIACKFGYMSIVKLLASKMLIDTLDVNNDSPLHHACQNGHFEIAKFLIQHYHCQVNKKNCGGFTALQYLTVSQLYEVLEIINDDEVLYNLQQRKETIWNILDLAFKKNNFNLTRLILMNFEVDSSRNTALHYACATKNFSLVKFLGQKKMLYMHIKNCNGFTSWEIACQNIKPAACDRDPESLIIYKHLIKISSCELNCKMLQFLQDNEVVECLKYRKPVIWIIFTQAFNLKDYKMTDLILNQFEVNSAGDNALHHACSIGNPALVGYLHQQKKFDIYCKNSEGLTPLQVACKREHIHIFVDFPTPINWDSPELAEPSLLWEACKVGFSTLVEYLINEKKCNKSVVDAEKWTILHCAASQSKSLNLVKYIVDNIHCNLFDVNIHGEMPVFIACRCRNWKIMIFLLQRMKGDPQKTTEVLFAIFNVVFELNEVRVIKYLVEFIPSYLKFVDNVNNNLLHAACIHNKLAILEELFSLWTKDEQLSLLLQKNKEGLTPLSIACSGGELDIIKFLIKNVNFSSSSYQWSNLNEAFCKHHLSIIKYFSKKYKIDSDGSTALHHACASGKLEIVRHLSGHGDEFTKNNAGHTPIECACIKGHLNIVQYFVQFLEKPTSALPLTLSIKNGHIDIVKYLVEKKLFLKSLQNEKMTTLEEACSMGGTFDVIQYLLSNSIIIMKDNEILILLDVACKYGNIKVVKYLLDEFQALKVITASKQSSPFTSLTPYQSICNTENGYYPLHTASRYKQLEVASYLIKFPLLWTKDTAGCTPLHIACHYANIMFVKSMCSDIKVITGDSVENYNSLVRSTDNNSLTAIHHACYHSCLSDSLEIIKYLISEFDINASIKDCKGMTALHHSCASGNLEVVRLLAQLCSTAENDLESQTPLHHAASNGHLDIVEYLVSMEDTSLMCADGNNNTPFHVAVISDNLDIVKFFLDKNYYDPNLRGENGKTPLIIAASHKCTQTFDYLFDQHADRHMVDDNGLKIIRYVYDWGREDVIDTLLLYSQVSLSSSCHKTKALLYSAVEAHHFESFKYILSSLLDSEQISPSDVLAQYVDSSTNNTALHLASIYGRVDVVKYLILDIKCDPNILNSEGLTCLHLASIHGKTDIVRFLFENNVCDPLYTDSSGKTSLHLATRYNQLEVLQYCIEELKLDPQVKDNFQNTPLHIASQRGYKVIAEYLINTTKSVQYNIDGNTPLHLAVQNEHFGIVEVLLPTAKYDIYKKNKQKMSVVDYAQNNPDIARHIREIYGIEVNLIPKVFIVGFPRTGKSTLYRAIQKESDFFRHFKTVSKVPPHTVGVKSTEFKSKKYGAVQLYDFAGDEEYHANHQLLFQNTPLPIVILLINLTWSEEDIISSLKYWTQILINSKSTCLELKKSVKIVIIGSHYDKVYDNKDFLRQLHLSIKVLISKLQTDEISYAEQLLLMNCKKIVSAGMIDLQNQLHSICISCRAEIVKLIPFKMSLLCQKVLDMIYEKMSNEVAFSLETLCVKAREIQFIPEVVASDDEIIEYCNGLSYYGKILLLKDNEQPLNSWVILNEEYILSRFHESMKMLCRQSTNTDLISCGLVSLEQLQNEFKEQLEVILKYLKHFQICTEVSTESFSIIPSSLTKNKCQYYFFPSLIMRNRPDIFQTQPNDQLSPCYGWQLTYDEPPPPRFLQVLFVQLTVPVPGAGDVLQPVFNVWRNGIHIRYNDTTECVIEVSDTLTQLIFSVRCHKGNESKLLLRRSRLVDLILSMLAKNCPSITFSEYIFEPQHSFPVNTSLKKASLNRIAGAIIEGRTTVISSDASEYLDLEHLLCSEPILNLSTIQLKRIYLHPEDLIPPSVLTKICNTFNANWNDHVETKYYKHLLTAVFSYSIFTDRNIWEVANVELDALPTFMLKYKLKPGEITRYITGHHPLTINLKEGETIGIPFNEVSSEEYCYGHYLSKSEESFEPIVVEDCIVFCNVRKEDAGRYELHPKHKGWSGEIQFILNVEYEPIYVFAKGSRLYFELYEGSTQVIPFTVSSFPVMSADVKHTITFFKGPHELPATTRFEVNDSAITLNNIQLEDSGMYQISCKSINGQVGKEKFELHVWNDDPSNRVETLNYNSLKIKTEPSK